LNSLKKNAKSTHLTKASKWPRNRPNITAHTSKQSQTGAKDQSIYTYKALLTSAYNVIGK
jgi:hypothetical protein